MSRYKYCIVPMCTNTTATTPDKYFFDTPRDASVRKRWCCAMRRDDSKVQPLSSNTCRHVCQDHFDLESDVENYVQYRLVGGRMKLKKGILPHVFECQKPKASSAVAERAAKRQRRQTVSGLLESSSRETDESTAEISVQSDVDVEMSSDCDTVRYCDKAVQVSFYIPYKSKSTNTTGTQTSDFQCQVQPETQNAACDPIFMSSDFEHNVASEPIFMSSDYEYISSDDDVGNEDIQDSDYVCEQTSESEYEPEEDEEEFKKLIRRCMVKAVTNKSSMCLGIPENAKFLIEFLATESQCSTINILITLKKLRMNETYENLGMLFGYAPSTIAQIFKKTLLALAGVLQNFVFWPDDALSIKYCLPVAFRRRYSNVQSIIDCFEIPIQKPSNPLHQSLTWSDYYKDNTIKYLVSCTPDGTVSFVSRGYGGRATDAIIVEDCGYLNLLFPNLEVMADRGFKNIAYLLEKKSCKLVRPPSVSNGTPMSEEEVKETKRIAAVRIHVERVIGRLRHFSIIGKYTCVDNHLIQLFDEILLVVCGLSNLQSKIINV